MSQLLTAPHAIFIVLVPCPSPPQKAGPSRNSLAAAEVAPLRSSVAAY